MIHEHPLAYLLGLEGIALMRAFTGDFDRDFVADRIAEIRELLDDESLATAAVDVERVGAVEGYRVWSRTYDQPGNGAFALDEPVVEDILDAIPAGVALDAACGTGRYARLLERRGHRVVGVDSSPDMLARARDRVPGGEFLLGDLRRLPLDDDRVDVVTCGLALTHVPALEPVLAEFARVLRPGGHLVVADMHPDAVARGSNPCQRAPDGRPRRLVSHRHPVGDYLRAALPLGLRPLRCEEPRTPVRERSGERALGPWDLWPWCLDDLVPEAARAANGGAPAILAWYFRLDTGDSREA